jgi:glucose/arabinose dehydrogenase
MGRNDLRKLLLLLPVLFACNFLTPTEEAITPVFTFALPPESTVTYTPPGPTASFTPDLQPTPTATSSPNTVGSLPSTGGVQWTVVANDFQRPVDIAHAGDGRMFIVEQRGVISILEDGAVRSPPFLDIQDRVNDRANEQGLLGIAFHPSYAENGFFYLDYTDSSGGTVIARFQVSTEQDRADPESELQLLKIPQPYGNHNGGALRFGPDGYLYIGMGDGGSQGDPQGNAQNVNSLLGKILRIDVDSGGPYSVPASNPFANGGGSPEVWAYGLRNPWRISFDRATGDLYIGDVGQSDWEEIDFQPAGSAGGANYGWNHREGAHPYRSDQTDGLIDPVAEYPHDPGCSVSGGVVVRDPALPHWGGVYLYGDYCSGDIWGLLRLADGSWSNSLLFQTGARITSFGEGLDGAVYMLNLRGAVLRLETR